jgi:hypothetical protein
MKKRFGLATFALVVAFPLMAGTASARNDDEQVTEFDVHVGDVFLFSRGGSLGDVARASNGDTIEVIFTGKIDAEDGQAGGTGGFQHFDKSGKLLEFGTFKATRLISFTDFGLPSPPLPPQFPATSHGGSSLIAVRAVGHPASNPALTSKFDATLEVDCMLGNFPPGFEEGINLAVTNGLNFNEKVSGVTLYVAESED